MPVGVIGDFSPQNETHLATNAAFHHASIRLGVDVKVDWISTLSLARSGVKLLDHFEALVCAPGSPYRNRDGALDGIRFARENDRPFLGTCGGFQHVVLEYARDVMGIEDAEHAEEHPDAPRLLVTPLSCSLVGKVESVRIQPGSRAFEVYGAPTTLERFYCNYGLSAAYRDAVEKAGLRASGFDQLGEVRILELPTSTFFLATLFVPQASSSESRPHPAILALLDAAMEA